MEVCWRMGLMEGKDGVVALVEASTSGHSECKSSPCFLFFSAFILLHDGPSLFFMLISVMDGTGIVKLVVEF
jgi:hypothetical protein